MKPNPSGVCLFLVTLKCLMQLYTTNLQCPLSWNLLQRPEDISLFYAPLSNFCESWNTKLIQLGILPTQATEMCNVWWMTLYVVVLYNSDFSFETFIIEQKHLWFIKSPYFNFMIQSYSIYIIMYTITHIELEIYQFNWVPAIKFDWGKGNQKLLW